MRKLIAITALALSCAGCASYMTPGGPAPLAQITGAAESAAQPAPQFPLRLAAARVQAADYRSFSATGIGKGPYSVVLPPELLGAAELQAIAQWPQVAKAAVLDATLLPEKFESLADLRLAAAKMQADVLLVYTVDTAFHMKGRDTDPASKLALGDPPDADAAVRSKASAAFVDVRTGYVYGTAQADAQLGGLADAWASETTLDAKRLAAEHQAFAALLAEAQASWVAIVGRYQ